MCEYACVTEISKALDMHLFLFDDILLLTRVKKAPRKVSDVNTYLLVFIYFNSFNSQNNV